MRPAPAPSAGRSWAFPSGRACTGLAALAAVGGALCASRMGKSCSGRSSGAVLQGLPVLESLLQLWTCSACAAMQPPSTPSAPATQAPRRPDMPAVLAPARSPKQCISGSSSPCSSTKPLTSRPSQSLTGGSAAAATAAPAAAGGGGGGAASGCSSAAQMRSAQGLLPHSSCARWLLPRTPAWSAIVAADCARTAHVNGHVRRATPLKPQRLQECLCACEQQKTACAVHAVACNAFWLSAIATHSRGHSAVCLCLPPSHPPPTHHPAAG